METDKVLSKEELERVAGGAVPLSLKCDLCGHYYVGFLIDDKHYAACSNPDCPNSKPVPLFG